MHFLVTEKVVACQKIVFTFFNIYSMHHVLFGRILKVSVLFFGIILNQALKNSA